MSRLNWRSRSVLAAGAAAVLVGTGVAALATTGSSPGDDAPSATSPQSDDSLAEVRASLEDLMSQADALESSLATPTPTPTSDDDAYDDGAYDDAYDDGAYDDDGDDDDAYDDHGDDDDDDRGDDHGGEDEGDDD